MKIFICLSILLSSYTSVHAYNEDFFAIFDETIGLLELEVIFGETDEDAPKINLPRSSIQELIDLNNNFELLQRRLQLVPKEQKKLALWHELDNFLSLEHIMFNECKVDQWSYVEDWKLTSHINIITYYNDYADNAKIVKNYDFLSKAIRNVALLAQEYNQRAGKAVESYLVPSKRSLNATISSLENSYLVSMDDIFDTISKRYTCPTCKESFPKERFENEVESVLKPMIIKLIATLETLQDRASLSVYPIPDSVKKRCISSTMSHVAGLYLRPEEILQIGLSELNRAESDMLKTLRAYLKKPTLTVAEMNIYLESIREEQLNYVDAQEYLDTINELLLRTEKFSSKVTSKITSIPMISDLNYQTDRFSTTYSNCTINVNNKAPTMKYSLASLMIHEGITGHHLDLCKDGESIDFPARQDKLSNHQHNTDRTEGWAFYMEEVADELGFFETPLERVGNLEWSRVRAMRLILTYRYFFDGWSMEEALAYHKKHAVLPDYSHNAEINRATGYHGQVLNYLLGKVAIKEMRKQTKSELGEKFDLIKFHDFILYHQNISLNAIKNLLPAWIDLQR
jgi:uncharacterized protein (DUF885 family)